MDWLEFECKAKEKGYKYICNKEAQGQIECIKDSLK